MSKRGKARIPALRSRIAKPALLHLLRDRRSYGYELVSHLQDLGLVVKDPSRVYRLLDSMERTNLLRSQWDLTNGPGPPRRVYAITAKGRRQLDAWDADLEREREMLRMMLHGAAREDSEIAPPG